MAYNILLVDDSSTMRAVIKRTIGLTGLDVAAFHEAGNGLKALELLEKKQIDLALIDINMPEMSGLELINRVIAKQTDSLIPIIVVTTETNPARIGELKEKGVKSCVHKPFTPEQIRKAILEALGVCYA